MTFAPERKHQYLPSRASSHFWNKKDQFFFGALFICREVTDGHLIHQGSWKVITPEQNRTVGGAVILLENRSK